MNLCVVQRNTIRPGWRRKKLEPRGKESSGVRFAPSSKGVPFNERDSSSGHHRFKESMEVHFDMLVDERDKCVNFEGIWESVGTGIDSNKFEERMRRLSLAND